MCLYSPYEVKLSHMTVLGKTLIVLEPLPEGSDCKCVRYNWLYDYAIFESFDGRKSGVCSILDKESATALLHTYRLHLYDGSDRYVLTEDQKEVFGYYRSSYLDYLKSGQAPLPAEDFAARMVNDLRWLRETFSRIYAFKGQVEEFLEHAGELKYQAMWMVLMEYAQDVQHDDPILYESWSEADAYARLLSSRSVIKDLLVIFANKALRELIFGV